MHNESFEPPMAAQLGVHVQISTSVPQFLLFVRHCAQAGVAASLRRYPDI